MATHIDIGKAGEKLAEQYLAENDYTILHRNWRFGHDEIDIIATKHNMVHFVEVKYRSSNFHSHPEEAVKFVKETGVDSLAVAIGNSHGAYKFKGEQHLDLNRLKAIKKALMDAGLGDYPLVLHGASSVPKDLVTEINKYGGKMGEDIAGVPEADIEIARRTGCTKVNIDTDLRLAMTAAIRKVLFDNPKEFDPRKYLGPARTKVKELVRHKVKNVLCCAGHAFD